LQFALIEIGNSQIIPGRGIIRFKVKRFPASRDSFIKLIEFLVRFAQYGVQLPGIVMRHAVLYRLLELSYRCTVIAGINGLDTALGVFVASLGRVASKEGHDGTIRLLQFIGLNVARR
jgi:hypothetical protein